MTDEQPRYVSVELNLLQFETSKNKKQDHLSLPIIPFEGGVYNANGHSPGTSAGRKTSNHINGNSWLLPVGRLLTDGGELCVMCLTSLQLTHINLCPSHY